MAELDRVTFTQANVANQAECYEYGGNFFLLSEYPNQVIGGAFAFNSMEAMDILADEGMMQDFETDILDDDDPDFLMHCEELGAQGQVYFLKGINITHVKVNADITAILGD